MRNLFYTSLLMMFACSMHGLAQFDSGSDGSDGALLVETSTTLTAPEDGIFNFTSITINQGTTLTFDKNAANTPIYLLASEDVVISGIINVNGQGSTATTSGAGGPGGFDGGSPASGGLPAGDGKGPGGGKAFNGTCSDCNNAPGSAAFRAKPTSCTNNPLGGEPYASGLLIPLIGGSGGGGSESTGGAGGGGAILIASNTSVTITGSVQANGGSAFNCAYARGSGGAVRIVAPQVFGTGSRIQVGNSSLTGSGYARIDTLVPESVGLTSSPSEALFLGSFLSVFPQNLPTLRFVEVAGTSIPANQTGPVDIFLPDGTPASQTVRIEGADLIGSVPIVVQVSPLNGSAVNYTGTLDMAGQATNTVDIQVDIPANIAVRIFAWTDN